MATAWFSGGHFTQGTVKLNDTYFATSRYNNAYARRHVLCQEVGHALGLWHTGGTTCMNDSASTLSYASYVAPNYHDYEQLAAIHSHRDGTTTVSTAAVATFTAAESVSPTRLDPSRVAPRSSSRTSAAAVSGSPPCSGPSRATLATDRSMAAHRRAHPHRSSRPGPP